MSKKRIASVLLGMIIVSSLAQGATVIWVADDKAGLRLDQAWVDLLVASGYDVNQDYVNRQLRGDLDPEEVAALEAADLVIFSRDAGSGGYNRPDQWNAITTPILVQNAFQVRANRWRWLNSSATTKGQTPILEVEVGFEQHPLFHGLGLDDNNYQVEMLSSGNSWVDVFDIGNGQLIAYRADNGWPWIVEWEAGQEFYPGAAQTAGGRRMYFSSGGDTPPPGVAGIYDGGMNLTRVGKIVFLNAVDYMTGLPNPFPTLPIPDDKAIVEEREATLEFRNGAFAVGHKVYLSRNKEDVENTLESALVADTDKLTVPLSDPLMPGDRYYWRVVEVNDANNDSPWPGVVWSFQVRAEKAFAPIPIDGMPWVNPDNPDLQWDYGIGAVGHAVYFSTERQAVADAASSALKLTITDPEAVMDPNFGPGALQQNTTYYWRVDEILADDTRVPGDVWSFTTLGDVEGIVGEYFNNMDLTGDPSVVREDATIDFLWELNAPADGIEADYFSVRWTGELQVPWDDSYTFIVKRNDGVRLWIDSTPIIDGWSNTGGFVSDRGTVNLEAGRSYSLVMEFYSNDGEAGALLSWTSDRIPQMIVPAGALSAPLKASRPNPGHQTTDVSQTPVLTWVAGSKANQHDIYFGTDPNAVANATPETAGIYVKRQPGTSYTPPALAWNTTYYWRIDEIDPGHPDSPWKGSVWCFTTANSVVIDDFENYTGSEGSKVFETWLDGYIASELGGSIAGYLQPPYVDTENAHGGFQSFPLLYDNDGGFVNVDDAVSNPTLSEVQRDFDPAQDWRQRDGFSLQTLSLWFYGAADNGADNLYLRIIST